MHGASVGAVAADFSLESSVTPRYARLAYGSCAVALVVACRTLFAAPNKVSGMLLRTVPPRWAVTAADGYCVVISRCTAFRQRSFVVLAFWARSTVAAVRTIKDSKIAPEASRRGNCSHERGWVVGCEVDLEKCHCGRITENSSGAFRSLIRAEFSSVHEEFGLVVNANGDSFVPLDA
jgi:hypothetical protein